MSDAPRAASPPVGLGEDDRARSRAGPPARLDEVSLAELVPVRDPDGHKGSFGTLALVAGSLEYAGAALLAGTAALRAGAGLVMLWVPAALQAVVAGRVPELVTMALPETADGEVDAPAAAAAILERPHDALVVGPGLRPGRATGSLVARLLAELPAATRTGDPGGDEPGASRAAPAVLDAEALNQLAHRPGWWRGAGREAVLTPHPGEFERLTGSRPRTDDERAAAAASAAQRWGRVVVLKGARTVIASPDGRTVLAPFTLPALATAGSGDVLAGITGSLLAQGLGPFDAACLAVHVHGMAAEHVVERVGDAGLLASDLLTGIPRVRRHLTALRDRRGGRVGFGRPGRPP